MTNSALPLIDVEGEQTSRGVGVLTVKKGDKKSRLPLAGVDITARVADRVAEVKSVQRFHNPFNEHLEAVYIFPLSGGCAVSSFKMRVGDRVIVGKVDERAQARQQYQQAIQAGHRAALLEQERDDVFTVQVGNLPPGEEVTIEIAYSERLSFFEDGTTEVRLPLVVAPRYIPGEELPRDQVGLGIESDTDIVPDASRITPPRLAPGFDPKVSLNIGVELLPSSSAKSSGLADLACSQHAVSTTTKDGVVTVRLMNEQEPLNRDFVLRWRLAEEKLKTGFIYFEDPATNECYGMLSLIPPVVKKRVQPARDIVFVLDRSGSMGGLKIVSAVRACSVLLNSLGPNDRFAILAFDNAMEWMSHKASLSSTIDEAVAGISYFGSQFFTRADEEGIVKANDFLRTVTARGGTEIGGALNDAMTKLDKLESKDGRTEVVVLITDGQIGQESQVLRQLQSRIGDRRIFTVGIDTAVNAGFLNHVAQMGRGTCTCVKPGAQLEDALANVAREIGEPLVTEIKLDGDGLITKTIVPYRIPEVFVGRASTCLFKFKLNPKKEAVITVRGTTQGKGKLVEEVKGHKIPFNALAQIWARQYISELEDQFRLPGANQDAVKKEIISVSVKHSILTRFTAFVVVDEAEVVNAGGQNRTMVQPVEQPALWSFDDKAVDALFSAPAARLAQASGWGAPSPAPAPPCAPQPAAAPFPAQAQGQISSSWDQAAPLNLAESVRRKVSANEPQGLAGGGAPPPSQHQQFQGKAQEADGSLQSDTWGAAPPQNAWGNSSPQSDAWGAAPTGGVGEGSSGLNGSRKKQMPLQNSAGNSPNQQPASPPAPQAQKAITSQDVLNVLVHTAAMGISFEPSWTVLMQAHGITKEKVESEANNAKPVLGGQHSVSTALSAAAWEFARQFRALVACVEQKNSPSILSFEASRWALYCSMILTGLSAEKMLKFLGSDTDEILRLYLAGAPDTDLKAAIVRIMPAFQEAVEELNLSLSEKEKGTFWEASI